ncbi:MAG: endonuclease/exonuclease/phosphatase family protein [Bacteroidota bacterium]
MIKKIFLVLNIIFIIILVLSYLSPITSPESNSYIPILGLGFPILFIINIFIIFFWLIFKPLYSILSIVAFLIGFNVSNRYWAHNENNAPIDSTMIKVMSYNVKNFDVYNYTLDWNYKYETRNKIFDLLKEENPDILCFQEYYYENTKKFKTTDTLKTFLKANHFFAAFPVENRKSDFFGIAIFTKYQIVNKGKIEFETKGANSCIFLDVLINKDTVRIYNLHFESIRFQKHDYEFAQKVSDSLSDQSELKLKQGARVLFTKLNRAFKYRAKQSELVEEHIKTCKYPTILCGDFNDTPISYAYKRIYKHLNDAFINAGTGLGTTYAGKIIPAYRIDYIFHSDDFQPFNFNIIKKQYSDHYPITCYLKKIEK